MKSLEKFENLAIADTDIIIVSYPNKEEASKLYLDEATKRDLKKMPKARPMVIAKVGSNVTDNPEMPLKGLKAGDFVFVNEMMVSQSTLLGFDEERRWKNPIITNAFAVNCKVIYGEDWEKEYDSIAESINEKIAEHEAKLAEIEAARKSNTRGRS
jgi:hypothetical protein